MITYKNIKSKRQWKATTGLCSDKFHRLCKVFGACYINTYGLSLSEIEVNLRTEFLLKTYEDCLFFVLFQMKNGLTYDSLGLLINTDSSNAQRNYEKYLSILESALESLSAMPKRSFKNISEFESYLQEKEIIIDATEHATQRPEENEAQKEVYSGKKKLLGGIPHTYKELIISNKNRQILYISKTYKGKQHDYSLLKQEFPAQISWFDKFIVHLDLGFIGFADLYPCKKLHIPVKKKRAAKGNKNELNETQKKHNKEEASQRIFVEHSIGGMKRYKILVHRNRLKNKKIINQTIGVCAALWNFNLQP